MQDKPRIKLYPKMLVATALNCLEETTSEYVIHEKTNISTPLGVIVIAEITKQGEVLVAGPSTNNDMKFIVNLLKKYQASMILIDGALFRKSIANTYLSDAIILSTGASYNKDIDIVVTDTKIFIDQLSLPQYKRPVNTNVRTYENTFYTNVNTNENKVIHESLLHNEDILSTYLGKFDLLYIKGALTDRIYQILVNNRNEFKKLKIVVKDATNILMKPNHFRNLSKIGVEVEVLNQIEILFVTFNPYSPFSYDFNNEELREKLQKKISKKIINVLTDLE
ncbi:hypothetical protein KQ51_00864 [Candidatus Izimaplasma bacterium HR1]|jgi:hypothetical protein|uniref:lysine 5,6-aminomutase reactivase subunit KamB n=1 Tax=Candidatus Izimoplasma sp. HR1 TaxID=1541959 RepID=UPI0004F6DAB7|nr:hypothetical protein KQ51_00864 [Candidatus Izimaplasma bacterium HR1]